MIANKNKDGFIKIFFFFSSLNKSFKTKVSISESIQFLIALETKSFQGIVRIFFQLKCSFIFIGNRVWPVVICSLNHCKKRMCFIFQDIICRKKKPLVTYSPNINRTCLIIALFIYIKTSNVIGKQSPDISPTEVTADKIIFIIPGIIIYQRVLINDGRVSAGRIWIFNIRYTRYNSPYTTGSTPRRSKTPVKKNSLFAHLIEIRRCI